MRTVRSCRRILSNAYDTILPCTFLACPHSSPNPTPQSEHTAWSHFPCPARKVLMVGTIRFLLDQPKTSTKRQLRSQKLTAMHYGTALQFDRARHRPILHHSPAHRSSPHGRITSEAPLPTMICWETLKKWTDWCFALFWKVRDGMTGCRPTRRDRA